MKPFEEQTLIEKLRTRARIRRQIPGRKSVQEGATDRIADLLDEAADELERKDAKIDELAELLDLCYMEHAGDDA